LLDVPIHETVSYLNALSHVPVCSVGTYDRSLFGWSNNADLKDITTTRRTTVTTPVYDHCFGQQWGNFGDKTIWKTEISETEEMEENMKRNFRDVSCEAIKCVECPKIMFNCVFRCWRYRKFWLYKRTVSSPIPSMKYGRT
jgi:hypothetical protein